MVSDNTKIIMGLSDTFSFEEYVSACSAKGLPPDNIGVFLQVAGMVEGGKGATRAIRRLDTLRL